MNDPKSTPSNKMNRLGFVRSSWDFVAFTLHLKIVGHTNVPHAYLRYVFMPALILVAGLILLGIGVAGRSMYYVMQVRPAVEAMAANFDAENWREAIEAFDEGVRSALSSEKIEVALMKMADRFDFSNELDLEQSGWSYDDEGPVRVGIRLYMREGPKNTLDAKLVRADGGWKFVSFAIDRLSSESGAVEELF
jgi:hypothetical protein